MRHKHSPSQTPRIKRNLSSSVLLVATSLLFITTTCAIAESEFQGTLSSVSITDAAGSNSPPTASFTHSFDGDTVTLDASDSTDSDGSIITYEWKFSDGTTSEGSTTTFTPTDTESFKVTLTLVDDNDAVTLRQQTISLTSTSIADDFSTDSSSEYSIITGSLTITDDTAHGGTWKVSEIAHNTALESDDHYVTADVDYLGGSESAGVLARVDTANNTGYLTYFSSGKIHLASFSGSSRTWLALFDGNYTSDIYNTRMEVSGNIITVYVNEDLVITKTDTSYPVGKQVGLFINRSVSNEDVTADNLKADVL